MKILHIISSPAAGGAEIFVKDLILNSVEKNIQPSVLFISSAKEIGRSEEFELEYLKELKNKNIPFYFLPIGSRRNIFKGLPTFNRKLKLIQPTCIHAHLLSGIIYSKLSLINIPIVYTHHSSVIETNKYIFTLLMFFCSAFVGISNVCSRFLNQYLPKNKFSITIYNALDLTKFKVKRDEAIVEKSIPLLLAVGRISKEKNYQLLLESILLLKRKYNKEVKLQIAGDGDKFIKTNLESFIKESGLEENVFLLGNRSDIGKLMYDADVFVMSSLYEGFPIALLEAQSIGLPAVVTDVGGCKELLDITKGGMLVSTESSSELSYSLLQILNDVNLQKKMSNNAISNINQFSIDKCIDEHLKVYKSVI